MPNPKRALENQGLRVVNSRGENGEPTYLITDRDGYTYVMSRVDLEKLEECGKLSLAGIKEHDAKILNQTEP
ncbi:MAG TPA: hypothetical protein VM554_06425 [Acidisarcina sp.]|nr:hypothetical protein [Acidisarcina sp.]